MSFRVAQASSKPSHWHAKPLRDSERHPFENVQWYIYERVPECSGSQLEAAAGLGVKAPPALIRGAAVPGSISCVGFTVSNCVLGAAASGEAASAEGDAASVEGDAASVDGAAVSSIAVAMGVLQDRQLRS